MELFDAVAEFEHQNVGHEKNVPDYPTVPLMQRLSSTNKIGLAHYD